MLARVLYLDFDGVLHPATCEPEQRFSRATVLAEALGAARCDVVISSSWRFGASLGELRHKLPATLAKRVVGCTGDVVIGRHAREREILAHARQLEAGADWRALDDCAWDFSDGQRLIACNPNTGFSDREAVLLKAWLAAREVFDSDV